MEKKEIPEETKKLIENSRFLYTRTKYIFDFAIETWYPYVEKYTLKTEVLEVSIEEAEALLNYCEEFYNSNSNIESKNLKTEENKKTLSLLEQRINTSIESNFNNASFVKLSTRSPKDAVTTGINEKMKQEFENELKKSDGSPNQDTIAFVNAKRKCLKVTSGAEALELFRRSSRIREDLMRTLEFPGAFSLAIIIREWVEMDASMEFRGFVFNKKLNALSQYCYLQCFSNLHAEKQDISQRVNDFFLQISPLIPQDNYIVDLVFLEKEIKIIELNPFFADTSGCLFDWNEDLDRQTIKNGPFEFRILEKPIENPYGCLPEECLFLIRFFSF
ncbi:cell division cycle protein [Anaeramoeba ignava]|uniref:Cell division cycle protein n=1 Tax=Anaeramoeba ignava TaxID=1746090 RepID=A0A9Q0LRL4_ANAIG|nr:cell division cycle protein [Anaeramoeba ignava]